MGFLPQTVEASMIPPADTLSMVRDDARTRAEDNPFRSGRRERIARTALVACGLAGALALVVLMGGRAHLHAPDLRLLARQPLALRVHVAAALTALGLGLVLMLRPKGRALHRILGWAWVAAMLTTAVSSFLFPSVLKGRLDPIHGLSAYVLLAVPMGLAAARRHDIRSHRRWMTNLFMFGLVVAGAFTFAPGRLMWRMVFG
jgi:uncharacterized membrane protein